MAVAILIVFVLKYLRRQEIIVWLCNTKTSVTIHKKLHPVSDSEKTSGVVGAESFFYPALQRMRTA